MTHVNAELFADAGNNAVVRLPGRNHPGVLVQGDTLSIVVAAVEEALEALRCNQPDEARGLLLELAASLKDVQGRYESVLRAHGMELPY